MRKRNEKLNVYEKIVNEKSFIRKKNFIEKIVKIGLLFFALCEGKLVRYGY